VKLENSLQIFEKYSNTKLHENPSSGAELFNVDGQTASQTDGHDETNSHFSQFCERAGKMEIVVPWFS